MKLGSKRLTKTPIALSMVLIATLVGTACEGPKGEKGDPGQAGTAGTNGDPGLACWDRDGDGAGDPATEDLNGDGAVDVLDCAGATGPQGAGGAQGAGGPTGRACWDLDGDGIGDLDAEDTNGDGAVDVLDCAGTPGAQGVDGAPGVDGLSTGTIGGFVRDANSGGYLEGVSVFTDPLGLEAVTDASGEFTLAAVPIGVYTLTAVGLALDVSDTEVSETGEEVEAEYGPISVTAGAILNVNIGLTRFDKEKINIYNFHKAGAPAYANANCEICHTKREAEKSLHPDYPKYHSLETHAQQSCTFCHANVDQSKNKSGAAIRKQVDVGATCAVCHIDYPVVP